MGAGNATNLPSGRFLTRDMVQAPDVGHGHGSVDRHLS